jgi:hypothetical protein
MEQSTRITTIFSFMVFLGVASFPLRAQVLTLDKVLLEAVGLKVDEIRSIHGGQALAKVMESRIADEVFVFGAVRIEAQPESYVRLTTDLDALRKLPSYLGVRNFSNPPQISDLDEFTLDTNDIRELPNCEPGDCEVQLPSEAMEDFRRAIKLVRPRH